MSYTADEVTEIAKNIRGYSAVVPSNGEVWGTVMGMLRAYAATLRQQAEAKAGVTDEVARAVLVQYLDLSDGNTSPGDNITAMRAALEAVWPQAALAQTTQGEAVPAELDDAELAELARAHAAFNDGVDTDTPYATLLRWAEMGLLEVEEFFFAKKGLDLLAAAPSAPQEPK